MQIPIRTTKQYVDDRYATLTTPTTRHWEVRRETMMVSLFSPDRPHKVNELMTMMRLLLCSLLILSAAGFVVRTPASSTATACLQAKRGFGKEEKAVKKEPSPGMIKRQAEANKYDEIAATGGQEYRIHIRQFGSDDSSWLPCGSIAVPRDGQVANAIKANVDALKSSIVRTYPKLQGREQEFEFGYNLKIYPDDPIEVANLGTPLPQQGFSFGNWVSTLLSPIDTSGVPPPPIPDEPSKN